MEAGKLSFTVCEAFGLSSEMVTLREPTDLGDRGERGGDTESSDMVKLARRAGLRETVSREWLLGVARSPDLLGGRELGPRASRWRLCGGWDRVEGAQLGLHREWMRAESRPLS